MFTNVKKMFWVSLMLVVCVGCANTTGGDDGPLPPERQPPRPGPDIGKAIELTPFRDCSDLREVVKSLLKEKLEDEIAAVRAMCVSIPRYTPEGGENSQPSSADAAGTSDAPQVTGTNLQEAGVDEADLIKSDGTHTYAIIGNKVKIGRIWPLSDFGEVSTIEPKAPPRGLYLFGSRLVVVSQAVDSKVFVQAFDVTDPKSPVLVEETEYAGTIIDSRMLSSILYLVVTSTLNLPQLDQPIGWEILSDCQNAGGPTPKLEEALGKMREDGLEMIEAIDVGDILPVSDASDEFCRNTYRNEVGLGSNLVTIVSNDISEKKGATGTSTIMGDGGHVYVSREGLYVASPYADDEISDATIIHRFNLGGLPSYFGSRAIYGHLMDNMYVGARGSSRFSMAQFAMSEDDGFLRVATTKGHEWTGSSENFVTILDVNSSAMEVVGEVGNMGRGERIYAVRFIGKKGYVVTFKKVDPLYVLDLAEPTFPKIAGELKTPGFSTYLHPLDDGHLIGLGFNADDQGSFAWTQGLKVSVFDVGNPVRPSEVGNLLLGTRGSYSAAIEEHHAFTFDPERMLLALPVDIYDGGGGGSDAGSFQYSGVVLVKIDPEEVPFEIGHVVIDNTGQDYGQWKPATVLRTVIVGNEMEAGLITLTLSGLQLNRIDGTMSKLGEVE